MQDTPASRAAAAAATTLAVAIGLIVLLAMQATGRPKAELVLLPFLGLALAGAIILHSVFVGLLARRTGRSAAWYALGALITFPIGSAVGLILYEWRTRVDAPPAKEP